MSYTCRVITTQGGIDPDAPGLTGRVGGPLGKHAVASGVWFDPVPWSIGAGIVAWLLCMLRQVRCLTENPATSINPFASLCYSDITSLYQSRTNFWSGTPLYAGSQPLEYPPLTGGFIWVARWLTAHMGQTVSPYASGVQRLFASNTFFAVNAVMLFVCFMALVWAHLEMGRNSASPHTDGVRTRAWDAIFIAAAPVVIFSGLINWDLLAVALTALGMLAWARRRPLLAGLVIGLACAAKFYPLALLAVLFLLCLRAAKLRAYFTMLLGAVLAWLVANMPLIWQDPSGWKEFYTFNVDRGGDLGSIWYVLSLMGLNVPSVNVVETVLLFLCGAGIIVLALRAPRRPRVGQIGLLVMVAFLVFNKVYSPQYVLWLLPFVVLARPRILDLAVFTVSELAYYFAIWGFLDGVMGPGSGPDRLYWLSVGLRVGVQIWIAARVVDDVLHPWQDPVRGPYVDDPIGGVLDHAPDAPFMLAAEAPEAAAAPVRAPMPVVVPRATLIRATRGEPDDDEDAEPDEEAFRPPAQAVEEPQVEPEHAIDEPQDVPADIVADDDVTPLNDVPLVGAAEPDDAEPDDAVSDGSVPEDSVPEDSVADDAVEDVSEPADVEPEEAEPVVEDDPAPDEPPADEPPAEEAQAEEPQAEAVSSWDDYEALMADIDGILGAPPVPVEDVRDDDAPDDTDDGAAPGSAR